MSRRLQMLTIIAALTAAGDGNAADPPGRRLLGGRVLDAEGRPVREGKVMFGPQAPPAPFSEASTAAIDSEGRFRIELVDFPWISSPIPAAGPLRYLALSPGSRPAVGKVEAGPSVVDIRLEAEPWKTTDLVLTDRERKPVAGVEVATSVWATIPWARLKTDAEGRCQIAMAAAQPFMIAIQGRGYLPMTLTMGGIASEPTGFKLTLRDPIRGRVVDRDGKPLAGIRVGERIGTDFANTQGGGAASPPVLLPVMGMKQLGITDEDGRFVLAPPVRLSSLKTDPSGEYHALPQPLCFADEDLRRLAFLPVSFDGPVPDLEVRLRPTRRVRIPVERETSAPSATMRLGWSLSVVPETNRPDLRPWGLSGLLDLKGSGGDPVAPERIEVDCPAGSYRLRVGLSDPMTPMRGLGSAERDLIVPTGEGPIDLPPIRLEGPAERRLVGQVAPEIDAADLDTGRPVKLADFRGQVVVLDFWGYWCGPCTHSMPGLVEVSEHFRGRPVVFLGLHDQSIQSREEYDQKLKGVRHQLWGDRDLPFRIALDLPDPERDQERVREGNGITIRRYQIHGFPTLLVIDPEGRVAGQIHFRDHDRLEAMVNGLLEKRPER